MKFSSLLLAVIALHVDLGTGLQTSSRIGYLVTPPSSSSAWLQRCGAQDRLHRLRGGSSLAASEGNGEGIFPVLRTAPQDLRSQLRVLEVFNSQVPLTVRYTVSCGIANVLYFGLYSILLGFITSAGISVTIAYLCSVSWQHALHRVLVYGKDLQINAIYLKELAGIYMAYSIAFVLNPMITEGCIGLGKMYIAQTGASWLFKWLNPLGFLASLLLTGLLNFFTVSAVFEKTSEEENEKLAT
ncbi:hypothetical protein GUITHDRAFT_164505, partial [Guillardia theta CCMP2712]